MNARNIVCEVFFVTVAIFTDAIICEHISVEENAAALKGYSGNGLRSIAQGSAQQAHSAVAHQNAAAHQASYLAKSTLAQTALQAAATAQTALAGKHVLLSTLEEVSVDAQEVFKAELIQLRQAKQAAATANAAALRASGHVSLLTGALNSAQEAAFRAEETAHHAKSELASQTAMVETAKARLQAIQNELYHARADFEAVKEAAEHAAASAHQAQNNAAIASAHASIELQEAAAAGPVHDDEDEDSNSLEGSHSS